MFFWFQVFLDCPSTPEWRITRCMGGGPLHAAIRINCKEGLITGYLVITNWLAGSRQQICINQSYSNWEPVTSGVPQGGVLGLLLFLIYINDLDTNIISKMSKFADDTKLCHRARNPDDIMELQEDINKLLEWENRWQMSFNVHKCSVMHIWHKTMQSIYNMSNQQLPTTDQQLDLGIITKDLKWLKRCKTQEKMQNGQQSTEVHYPQFQVQKQRTDPLIIQIPSPPTSRKCSAILFPTFKARHW